MSEQMSSEQPRAPDRYSTMSGITSSPAMSSANTRQPHQPAKQAEARSFVLMYDGMGHTIDTSKPETGKHPAVVINPPTRPPTPIIPSVELKPVPKYLGLPTPAHLLPLVGPEYFKGQDYFERRPYETGPLEDGNRRFVGLEDEDELLRALSSQPMNGNLQVFRYTRIGASCSDISKPVGVSKPRYTCRKVLECRTGRMVVPRANTPQHQRLMQNLRWVRDAGKETAIVNELSGRLLDQGKRAERHVKFSMEAPVVIGIGGDKAGAPSYRVAHTRRHATFALGKPQVIGVGGDLADDPTYRIALTKKPSEEKREHSRGNGLGR